METRTRNDTNAAVVLASVQPAGRRRQSRQGSLPTLMTRGKEHDGRDQSKFRSLGAPDDEDDAPETSMRALPERMHAVMHGGSFKDNHAESFKGKSPAYRCSPAAWSTGACSYWHGWPLGRMDAACSTPAYRMGAHVQLDPVYRFGALSGPDGRILPRQTPAQRRSSAGHTGAGSTPSRRTW
jgi:hypothetical protein